LSGPKTTTVRYVPTEQERRAANARQLDRVEQSMQGELARAADLAARWAGRAPATVGRFGEITAPPVARAVSGDLKGSLDQASRELAALRRRIDAVVTACVAEEVRIIRRGEADRAEIEAARVAGQGPVRVVERTEVDLGEEEVVVAEAPVAAVHPPSAEDRVSRVEAILGRADGAVPADVATECIGRAATAEGIVAFDAALQEARRAVDLARAEAARAATERERARVLLDDLGGLEGPAADAWRERLDRVLVGEEALPATAASEVAAVASEATTRRLIGVLRDAGFQGLEQEPGSTAVGWLDDGDGTGSQVRVDGEGMILTPATKTALDPAAARSVDERNCRRFDELREASAQAGLDLGIIRRAGIGEVPVRVLDAPAATQTGAEGQTSREEEQVPAARPRRRDRGDHLRRSS
jgi:hypothetical protein